MHLTIMLKVKRSEFINYNKHKVAILLELIVFAILFAATSPLKCGLSFFTINCSFNRTIEMTVTVELSN